MLYSQVFQLRHWHLYRESYMLQHAPYSTSNRATIVTPALQELHRLPVTERIQYKLCLLVHKTMLGHTTDYIADLLTPVADSSTVVSRDGNGSVGHGSWVKWVTIFGWVTWVMGHSQCPKTHDEITEYNYQATCFCFPLRLATI